LRVSDFFCTFAAAKVLCNLYKSEFTDRITKENTGYFTQKRKHRLLHTKKKKAQAASRTKENIGCFTQKKKTQAASRTKENTGCFTQKKKASYKKIQT
jgi:hypothetical protein